MEVWSWFALTCLGTAQYVWRSIRLGSAQYVCKFQIRLPNTFGMVESIGFLRTIRLANTFAFLPIRFLASNTFPNTFTNTFSNTFTNTFANAFRQYVWPIRFANTLLGLGPLGLRPQMRTPERGGGELALSLLAGDRRRVCSMLFELYGTEALEIKG